MYFQNIVGSNPTLSFLITTNIMLILIVLLPLLGFLSGSLFGRFIGWGSCYITTGSVFLSLLLSLILFYDVTLNGVVYKLTMGNWIAVDSLNIDWSFCFDSLTSVMLIVVTFISTLVHLYSTEYMEYDPLYIYIYI